MTMLDRMRRHKNWLKWSLALVVLTFIIFYIPDFLNTDATGTAGVGATSRETVAEVDGHELTAGEFQQRYVAQMQAYQQQFGSSMNAQLLRQLGIDQQVLSQMVDEQVAVIEAEQQGIRVSDDELAQRIFAIPGLQENGQFIGEARYEQLLRSQRPPLTKGAFEERFRRSIMVDRLRAALTDWVGEQRSIKYLLIDRDQVRQKIVVPASDIQRYYNDNIQQYQTQEEIRASHILLKTDGKDEATVRKQAEAILAQVKGGADFTELAKKVTEDEGSKATGGDLGYFSRGRMVPEFETAAFAMQPGQTSDLVRSQFGFHIIRLVDKKAGTTRPLDEVRTQIQEQVAQQQADLQVTERARTLQARIKNPGDLAEAAGESGLMVQESGFFQRGDPVPGLGAAPQVTAAAFTLADDAVSGPLAAQSGAVFITVSGKKDPYVPKLDEVKEKVRQDAVRAKAAELSRQRAADVAGGLKAASNFAAAAKALGLEAKDTELVARGAALPEVGTSPAVDKIAFSLPVGGVSAPIATADGTVIIRVVQRDVITPEQLKLAGETFRAELLGERRNQFYAAYMGKAKGRMKVEVKPEVITRVTSALNL